MLPPDAIRKISLLNVRMELSKVFYDFLCGYHAGLARENLGSENAVNFLISIGAAILYHHQLIIHISRPAHCRENNATGGNAHQDQSFDPLRSQDRLKVSCAKSSNATLGDNTLSRQWGNARVYFGTGYPFAKTTCLA